MLEPVRHSWATGESIKWIRIHDLPDYVYFNHEIHVNKGIGCASCHGRVDEMPIMYAENSLQMEWCLNCHRNPGKNLRPTSEIYNMAWAGPSSLKPVWCAETGKFRPDGAGCQLHHEGPEERQPAAGDAAGGPIEQHPNSGKPHVQRASQTTAAAYRCSPEALHGAGRPSRCGPMPLLPASYHKFTSQAALGTYLADKYRIRTPNELQSCEVCHR